MKTKGKKNRLWKELRIEVWPSAARGTNSGISSNVRVGKRKKKRIESGKREGKISSETAPEKNSIARGK